MIKKEYWYFYITLYYKRQEKSLETDTNITTTEESAKYYIRAYSPIEAINILTNKLIAINCLDYHRIAISYNYSFPANSQSMQKLIKNKTLEEETRGAKKKPKKRGRPKKKPQKISIRKKKAALGFDFAVHNTKKVRKIQVKARRKT